MLTFVPWETAQARALVGVQEGVAAAAVLAGLLETRVAVENGYVAGVQGVLLPQDGGAHQHDLEAGEMELNLLPCFELLPTSLIWTAHPWTPQPLTAIRQRQCEKQKSE